MKINNKISNIPLQIKSHLNRRVAKHESFCSDEAGANTDVSEGYEWWGRKRSQFLKVVVVVLAWLSYKLTVWAKHIKSISVEAKTSPKCLILSGDDREHRKTLTPAPAHPNAQQAHSEANHARDPRLQGAAWVFYLWARRTGRMGLVGQHVIVLASLSGENLHSYAVRVVTS